MQEEKKVVDYSNSVGALIRKMESDYTSGTTKISKYVEFSQYENIERIIAYLNSKHISGEFDSMDREKPFINIVIAAVNLWYRATDIDRKNIRVKSTKAKNVLFSFLASLKLQEWMRKNDFGTFLNEWGRALAKYGSAPLKIVEQGDKLFIKVVNWSNLISDTINFAANPKVEKFDFTESELMQNKEYYPDKVKSLLDAKAKKTRETKEGQSRDNKSDYYEVYEIHGYFPESWMTGNEEDGDKYSYQMHVVSFVLNDESNEYDDFCLFKGREDGDVYVLTHLIKEDNREQSIGAVEYLFDAQWMQNHTVKAMKDQLDLASKLIFQTADGNLFGQNVLSAMEVGDIIVHSPNAPLTALNNTSHDIGALKTLGELFLMQGQRTVGQTEAISGELPANIPYSSYQIANTESHGIFEIMVENKGLQLGHIIKTFVIPNLKKQLDTTEEISEILSEENIQYIDSLYVPNEAIRRYNKMAAEKMFNDEVVDPFNKDQAEQEVRNELVDFRNQRFLKPSDIEETTWKKILEDIEWDIEIEVTSEASDKRAVMQTLSEVLKAIVGNPQILENPTAKMIFGKILEETGTMSALQLQSMPKAPTPSPIPQASGGSPKSVGALLNNLVDKTAN